MTIIEQTQKLISGTKYYFALDFNGQSNDLIALPLSFGEPDMIVLEKDVPGEMTQTIKCLEVWWNEQNGFEK